MSNPKAQLDVVNSRSVFEAYLIGRVMIFFSQYVHQHIFFSPWNAILSLKSVNDCVSSGANFRGSIKSIQTISRILREGQHWFNSNYAIEITRTD